MSDPRVMELLEEILESGRPAEEACAGHPELLWEVREQLRRCLSLDAEVRAIFPPSGDASVKARLAATRPRDELPRIPGYDVESVLGRGGMGVVYKATQLKLNRPVAVKMILAGAYAPATELARFMREAEAVANLGHAHIVQVHDVGDLDGLPYFTMEYVSGGHLGEKLAGTPQPADDAAALVVTLAGAVQSAHDAGIVHRDIKPANILLTPEGIPKITDFGLARHFGEDQTLTISGGRLGTPSYMAPEQAAGRAHAVGPRADIYSLGAVLYELLTGRPPFRAETAAATVLQVIRQEPAPPSRLNAKVPRDLETICLKCLNKDPERRYASAAALADDLTRFREGRPILARPPGWAGRLWRWGRREPAAAALVAAVIALVGLAVGGGFRLQRQQAEARAAAARQEGRTWQAVEAALTQATALQELGHWPEARAALEGAPSLLGASAPPTLRARLQQARANADMVVRLEDTRLRLSEGPQVAGRVSTTADKLYETAFENYGISLSALAPAEAAARVRGSAIRETLLAFLHDWLYWATDANREKLRALLERADDDEWRRQFRLVTQTNDHEKIKELAHAPGVEAQPPVILSGLGGSLFAGQHDEEARAMLRAAQLRHPADFWINYLLGRFLEQDNPREAVGYFRAAVAVRPSSDQVYTVLGKALRTAGDTDGAIAAFQQTVALNPSREVIGELAEVLARRGRLEEVRVVWAKFLEHDPPDYDSWYGYAQLCLFLGKEDQYRGACGAMLRRFGETDHWASAERTGLARLLLPASEDELRQTAALVDRAENAASVGRRADSPYLQFLKGLYSYRKGRMEEAISLLSDAAANLPNRPGPRLVLAMAQFRTGSEAEARKTLARAVGNYNWTESQADHTTVWVSHVLRREAEAMILPNLPAFLRGEYEPRDNDERLALLGTCQSRGLYDAAARLYADAFTADPTLAAAMTADCVARAQTESEPANRIEVLNSECRYLAARCAALAGCGLGADGGKLTDPERTRRRRQALEWLRSDLTPWLSASQSNSPTDRKLGKEMLTLWQRDPDLARLRREDVSQGLPAEEREEWNSLWIQVELAVRGAWTDGPNG